MMVNSFESRSDEKGRKTWAEGSLFPTEDDARDKQERQRDAMICAFHQKAEALGSQGSLKNHMGSLFECRFSGSSSVGLGYSFCICNKLPGAADAAAAPHHPLSRGPEECQSNEGGLTPTTPGPLAPHP